ncbi:MOSC domain-containing protein [Reichenbachiella ulvae]|uniref:MOSC domain-containing protein n=1 Tax=Reichenbachiella ulvae TaxID=2980104 RepID=A0ABT3CSJ3_9BACT|nr:MOSC domain-containing protein [Reichenbachiella ulvae]MCV9386479.1 MOSC domain-containing protein [Reichenbachiella ulvae]
MISVSQLFIYPLKSSAGISLENSLVTLQGLNHDRTLAVIDDNNQIITGREYPKLLRIRAEVTEREIQLHSDRNSKSGSTQVSADPIDIKIFSHTTQGCQLDNGLSEWLSETLEISCKLIALHDINRPILEKHGGKPGSRLNYGDASPILLLSEASLDDLNSRLDHPVGILNFRPNIVVKGCNAYEEDNWKTININGCLFDVHAHCPRCIFTTIDPISQIKSPDKEPLATLSQYRKQAEGKVNFGVYLVPRNKGHISIGDNLQINPE